MNTTAAPPGASTRGPARHLGLLVELAAYAAWLLVDAALLASLGVLPVAVAMGLLTAGVVLLRRWWRLIPVAAVAIVLSLTASVVIYLANRVLGLASGSTADVSGVFGFPVSMTEQLALAVLVVAALRRCTLPVALLLVVASGVAIVGAPLLRFPEQLQQLAVFSAIGWGGAAVLGLVVRELETRRRVALDDVRTGERMELARELHDVVAHHVTGIVVAAQAAAVVARTSPDDVDRALASIEAAGTDALSAMRRMVGVLRGQDGDGARTPGAELADLPALVARFDPDARLVRFTMDPALGAAILPAGVAASGFRVVQEALTNVRRHAPLATIVEVEIMVRGDVLAVTVRNDGVPGSGPPRPGGFGLTGMSERVTALGGTLQAGPIGPGVWSVDARLPLRPGPGVAAAGAGLGQVTGRAR